MANSARPPTGSGCLGTIVGLVVLAAIVVLGFFVGFIVLGVIAALLVVGLVAWAVDRILLALSPKRRDRRAAWGRVTVWRPGQVPPDGAVDATAIDVTAIDTTATDGTTTGVSDPPDGTGPDDPGRAGAP